MSTDYNSQAKNWKRNEPIYPSDFLARPVVFDLFKKIGKNKVVLDVACGEGYFSRKMAPIAKKIIAFDNSEGMIEAAKEQNFEYKQKIDYRVADMNNLSFIPSASIDICICNFVLHYLHPDRYPIFFKEIRRVLRKGGKLILCGPHPYYYPGNTIGGTMSIKGSKNFDYLKSRGKYFQGTIRTIYGQFLKVGFYHALLGDYLNSLSDSGLKLEKYIEPSVKKSLLKKFKKLNKLEETPIYIVLQAVKS